MTELFILNREPLNAGDRSFVVEEYGDVGAPEFVGSPAARRTLGVEPGVEATQSAMAAVLDHRSAGSADAERVVRAQGPGGGDGQDAVRTHVMFDFYAPQRVENRFYSSTPEERSRIKRDLLEVADKTLSRVTSVYGLDPKQDATGRTRSDVATGYVAIATPDQRIYRNGKGHRLRVEGVIVAIERHDGTLAAADGTRLASQDAQQLANEVAAKELEARGMGQEHAPQRDLSSQRGPGVEM